ncbi:MAG: hypothetical protein PVH29_14180 [Candidatus Zixiibacteriota bacterium]|jgi:hypothetical protein
MRYFTGWPRALGVAAAFLFIFALSCSDEGEPTYEQAQWKVAASFDDDTVPLAAEAFTDGACYIAGIEYHNSVEEMNAVLYRCRGEALELAFRADDPRSKFGCIGVAADSVWAGGYYHHNNQGWDPYIVRYDGATFVEVEGIPAITGSVHAIAPVSKDAAFVGLAHGQEHSVYYYENGTWRLCLDNLPRMWDIELAATPSGKVFVSCQPEPASPLIIHCSQDRGVTWHDEVVEFGPEDYVRGQPHIVTSGETLFAAATYIREMPTGSANIMYIFRRDAAPAGEGIYAADYREISTDTLPEVGALAVGTNGEGYGLGREIGYRRRAGTWAPQDFANMLSYAMWDVTGGVGGFWAIGEYPRGEGETCRVFVSP